MEQLKESNKNLINLRTNLITAIIVITSGIAGIILTKSFSFLNIVLLLIPGIYFDILFLRNIMNINCKIYENIRRLDQ